MNTRHPGNVQIRMPVFLADRAEDWARKLQWFTSASNGESRALRPAIGRVHAAAIAKLDSMPYIERMAFLTDGFRLILEREDKLGVPGRKRMRPYRSEKVRPAGTAKAA